MYKTVRSGIILEKVLDPKKSTGGYSHDKNLASDQKRDTAKAVTTSVSMAPFTPTESAPLAGAPVWDSPAALLLPVVLEFVDAVPLSCSARLWNALKFRADCSFELIALDTKMLNDLFNRQERMRQTYKTIPAPQWLAGVF